jgi:hypothetical protein
VIHNLDVDLLIDFLSNQCSDILSKVWREGDIVAGVFILEESEAKDLGVSTTTIIDYHVPEKRCKVYIHSARVEGALNVAEAAEAHLRQTLIDLVEENDWTCE